ncbi:MAG TPA: molybdopterin cofactor-binding domain-containing protein [Anaerolineales bacterium]|nr:molybdopterin cofactor-binding domain-containing protein [Anaerolineales bacterium]
MTVLGSSFPRIDAAGKVTGETDYPGDIDLPGQAYMKILFASHPHALIRKVDKSRAEEHDGVLLILTANDVPVNEYGLIFPDQPVLCGPGSSKPDAERVRFIGDQVAIVVAESEEIASEALKLIEVEYEPLPALTDPRAAMREDAILLHPESGSNLFCHYKVRKGDVDSAFSEADVIVEGEYHTPVQEHAYLQPEAGLAYIDEDDRITVVVAGQWTHEDQTQIAHALDLPTERIRVIYPAIGGAFGGREDMSIQIVLALAVYRLSQKGIFRPVKIIWSRDESIAGHHKRHAFQIRTRWGATHAGKILAAEAEVIADGGAYIYTSTKVLGNATFLCTGPYLIPNVRVDSYAVYTNNLPAGAFRGFGGPQAAFAAEMQIGKLAEALGLDPVEIRERNIFREGAVHSMGTVLPEGVTAPIVLERCAQAAGWQKTARGWERSRTAPWPVGLETPEPHLLRGVGFATSLKNVGFSYGFPERCWATVVLEGKSEIERVIVNHAGADVGQGAHTVFAQMAAEAVGVPLDRVVLNASDTAESGDSGSASASRMTFMAGNAIIGAARLALQRWEDEDRPARGDYKYVPRLTTAMDPETGFADPNISYGYVAQAVALEVDSETGHIHILDVISANDVGRALNPDQVTGQIEGAVVQAAGYAILENFVQKDGYVMTPHLSTYLIPGILDIPDRVQSLILEFPDPQGPWGARGMAEMPFLPFVPAVTAAIHDATGVWIDEFPLTPERVLLALGKI